jgi:hypothetical protein
MGGVRLGNVVTLAMIIAPSANKLAINPDFPKMKLSLQPGLTLHHCGAHLGEPIR